MRFVVILGGRELQVAVRGDQVEIDGSAVACGFVHVPGTPLYHLTLGGRSHLVAAERGQAGQWHLLVDGARLTAQVVDQRIHAVRQLTGRRHMPSGAGVVTAPMPGLVVRVLVAPGDPVAPGQGLVVLEAMKMENELRAPATATVRTVLVEAGQAVEKGAPLIELGSVDSP